MITFKEFVEICDNSFCDDCQFFEKFCMGCDKESETTDVISPSEWGRMTEVKKRIYLKYSRKIKLEKLLS